ncbi:ECF-type sigma factor [Gemmatimonas sp.]
MAEPSARGDRDADLTQLLREAQHGDTEARDRATRLVYDTLHQLASRYVREERADITLQPTALVHEAYLRLLGQHTPWQNRSHFFGIAAQTMRRILVDHARRSTAARRDHGQRVSLDALHERVPVEQPGHSPLAVDDAHDILGVHEALAEMERVDARQAQLVALKFFVGLTLDEIAEVMGISPATVSREWSMARVWLRQRLDTT